MTKLPVLLAALFVLWTTCPGVQAAGRTLQTAAAPTTTSGVSDGEWLFVLEGMSAADMHYCNCVYPAEARAHQHCMADAKG
jgi:hypothetical protein